MATINNGTSILQVNVAKLRRPLEEINIDGIEESRERSQNPVLYQSSRDGTLDFVEFFSGSSYLSVACATRGLRTAPPVDLRRKAEVDNIQYYANTVLITQKPMVIVLEPSSQPWTWMKSKWKKWETQEWAYPLAAACSYIAEYQIKEGRYFIIKQPANSNLWNLKPIKYLCDRANSFRLHWAEYNRPVRGKMPNPIPTFFITCRRTRSNLYVMFQIFQSRVSKKQSTPSWRIAA